MARETPIKAINIAAIMRATLVKKNNVVWLTCSMNHMWQSH